jgi:hypothetical protein
VSIFVAVEDVGRRELGEESLLSSQLSAGGVFVDRGRSAGRYKVQSGLHSYIALVSGGPIHQGDSGRMVGGVRR